MKAHPDRVYNIGILEQATVSLAAGLATVGYIPVIHTITPFLIERSLEQLKIDFCYQKLGGNFISVGASYDYAALGCTHHCPGDVGVLKNLPGMEIVVPGTAEEFNILFRQAYANGHPTYFRLGERSHTLKIETTIGKGNKLKEGTKGTVVVFGNLLDRALQAVENLDVTVLYFTTLIPFDSDLLKNNCPSGKIVLVEPFYSGSMMDEIIRSFPDRAVQCVSFGVPMQFMTNYGTVEEHDHFNQLDTDGLRTRMEKYFHA